MDMYYNLSDEELRSLCRSSIETLEMWARRLIDEKMSSEYGHDYLNAVQNGNYIINHERRLRLQGMIQKEPGKYPRVVDACTLDDLRYIFCKEQLYKPLFKEALDYVYPLGKEEVSEFLNKINPIRDALSHARPISIRHAEQAICYSNDFVEGLKRYYKDKGMDRIWNVPRIIKVTDSFGNVFDDPQETGGNNCAYDIENEIHCGDVYSASIEVDPTFSPDEYDVFWYTNLYEHKKHGGNNYVIKFDEKDIQEEFLIFCEIISNKNWHRFGSYDFELILALCILPPI